MKKSIELNKLQKGQSLVEMVFAIGVAGLVMTGAAALILNSLATQSKKFDHKKASELAAAVSEELVAQKNNQPEQFWTLQTIAAGTTRPDFAGYSYGVTFNRVTTGGKCSNVVNNCATATITVVWQSSTDPNQKVVDSRFFGRN